MTSSTWQEKYLGSLDDWKDFAASIRIEVYGMIVILISSFPIRVKDCIHQAGR